MGANIESQSGHNLYINQSWKQILPLISEKLYTIAKKNQNAIKGVIGQFIDEETISLSKRFLNQLGAEASSIFIQNSESKWNKNIDIDFRTNYLLNKKLNEFGPAGQESAFCDFILLIGSTPRYEAALLNVRLRQLVIKKNIKIASIGFPIDLTYSINQLGNGMKTLYQLAQGKHNALYQIFQAKNPNIILGFNIFQREDGDALKFFCDWILKRSKNARELISCHKNAVSYHHISNKILGTIIKNY